MAGLTLISGYSLSWIRGSTILCCNGHRIQRRENDLALGTFGRGFYVLDDYTPLRQVSEEALGNDAILFPVRDALTYVEKRSRQMSRGHGFYTAANPPFGSSRDLLDHSQRTFWAVRMSPPERFDPPKDVVRDVAGPSNLTDRSMGRTFELEGLAVEELRAGVE